MQAQPTLSELVEAVADGRTPDFSSVDLSSIDAELRARIESLRALFQIGQCFSTLTGSTMHGWAGDAGRVSSAPPVRPIPATWGALHLRERVGRGRFGDVYRAWDPATARDVALKLLRHPSRTTDSAVVDEARLMARVRHPNVVTIYGAAHDGGQTGLWMEFIEGQTLEAELRRAGALPPDEVARIGIEVCRALAAVHEAGLVHRDVKAQNVMREVTGRIVLGDFGTGLEIELEGVDTTLAGTPVYLAPEIFEGQPALPPSDIYSLGVLLFHLATGSFPVFGGSVRELREAHRTRKLPTPIDARLPAAFAWVIERALSPQPRDRFQTAVAMQAALEEMLTPAPGAAVGTSSSATPARVRYAWSAAAALLIVFAITLGSGLRPSVDSASSLASLMPWLGPSSGANTTTPTRQLRRVPAPRDAMFWGQPSSDGRTHAFVDMSGNVAVFDTVTGEIRHLSDDEAGGGMATENVTFSPDDTRLAFGWELDGRRQVRILNTNGGSARVVWQGAEWPVVFDWSRTEETLLAVLQHDGRPRRLVTISIPTGTVTEIAAVDVGFSRAAFSPDGRHIVFDGLQAPDSVERDIYITSVDGPGEPRALVADVTDDFGPVWMPNASRLIFVSDRTAEPSIWGVSVDEGGGVVEPAVILHRNIGRVRPNGVDASGSLFYTLQVGLVEVFRAALDETRRPVLSDIRPVAPAQVGSKMNSDWSPDGDAIVYVALPHAGTGGDRTRRLAIVDSGGTQVRMLNPPLSYYSFPRWSPDGRWILVKGTDLAARTGVFLVDARSGEVHLIAQVGGSTPHSIGPVRWGRDISTLFFTRRGLGLMVLDLRTHIETRVLDPKAEGLTEFTNNPGFAFSPDGQLLAYSARRRTPSGGNETVLRVRDGSGRTRDLLTGPVVLQTWTRDDEILFTRSEGESQHATLWAIPANGGEPRLLSPAHVGLRDVQVHGDGRQITFTSGFPGSELWALHNFLPDPRAR